MHRKESIRKLAIVAAAAVCLNSQAVCFAEEQAAPPAEASPAVQPAEPAPSAPADTSGAAGGETSEVPAAPADTSGSAGGETSADTSGSAGGETPAASADASGSTGGETPAAPSASADTSGSAEGETPAASADTSGAGSAETPESSAESSGTGDGTPAAQTEGEDAAAAAQETADPSSDTAAAEKEAADKKEAEQKAAAAAAWYYYRRGTASSGVASDRSAAQRKIRRVLLTEETELCVENLDALHTAEETVTKEEESRFGKSSSGEKTESEKSRTSEDGIAENTPEIIGDWELPILYERALQNLLKETEKAGYHVGLVMIDIRSGKGITVNPDRSFYSASSIKGPFVISLAALYPQTLEKQKTAFKAVAVNSDNVSYSGLVRLYGRRFYDAWREAVGVEAKLDQGDYANVTAQDLARLWLLNYQYISGNPKYGKQLGELFETPNRSAIKPVLGEQYKTQTKGGWIAMRSRAAADAGIVYAGEHPYILSLVSDYPGDLKKLEPYTELLNKIHAELVSGRLAKKQKREYDRQ